MQVDGIRSNQSAQINSQFYQHSALVEQAAYQVNDAAFAHFFHIISPWNLAKTITGKAISLVSTAVVDSAGYLFELTKDAVLSTHVIFLNLYRQLKYSDHLAHYLARFVQYNIHGNDLQQKVQACRAEIALKTGSPVCCEVARVGTEIAFAFLKEHVCNIESFDPSLHPDWVQKYLFRENHYTLTGNIAKKLIDANEQLCKTVIESTLLKLLGNIHDHLQKVQSQGAHGDAGAAHREHFPLLDFLTDALENLAVHFSDSPDTAVAPKDKQEPFYKALAESLLPIALPNGAQDIELPVSKTVASYLSVYIFNAVKDEALPLVLNDLYDQIRSKECKDLLILQALTALHEFIDQEHPQQASSGLPVQYHSVGKLSKAIHDALSSFLGYANLDPGFLNWILTRFAPQAVGSHAAAAICKELEKRSLQQLFLEGLQEGLKEINPGGKWQDDHFLMAQVTFTKTIQEAAHIKRLRQEKLALQDAEIAKLLQEIGLDPKGLMLAAKNQIYAAPNSKEPSDTIENQWAITRLARAFGSSLAQGYQLVSHGALKGGFALADLPARINKLTVTMCEKMKEPRHELLFFDIAQSAVQILVHKKVLPAVRASTSIDQIHPII
jgi:hypothetical protein